MVDENVKRKQEDKSPLTSLPKPCDYFDLIGGTSTGGCATRLDPHSSPPLIYALQYSRSYAWAASDGHRHRNKTLWYLGKTRLLSSEAMARRRKV